MQLYQEIEQIYSSLQDDVSRAIFWKRLEYSLSGRKEAVSEMVDAEIARYGTQDMMYRLLRWLGGHPGGVTVFGAGFAGLSVCSVLRRHGIRIDSIADNSRKLWGSAGAEGLRVIPPESIGKEAAVVIGVNSCTAEILGQLLSLGISRDRIFVPDGQWWVGPYPQYFDPEIVRPGQDEVFVDGGSLDGGDSLRFIRWCGGAYKAVYAFEPDHGNCGKLHGLAERHRALHVFEEALWSGEADLRFEAGQKGNSMVSPGGSSTVSAVSIDGRLAGENVTFIKMDTEGSEMEALAGCADTVRRCRPKLAICVYHKPEDIIEIPRRILEMDPEYRLYLRHYSYADTETVLYAV